MDTVEVKLLVADDGTLILKYPKTEPLWNMEGYYFLSSMPGFNGAMAKLSDEQVAEYGLDSK